MSQKKMYLVRFFLGTYLLWVLKLFLCPVQEDWKQAALQGGTATILTEPGLVRHPWQSGAACCLSMLPWSGWLGIATQGHSAQNGSLSSCAWFHYQCVPWLSYLCNMFLRFVYFVVLFCVCFVVILFCLYFFCSTSILLCVFQPSGSAAHRSGFDNLCQCSDFQRCWMRSSLWYQERHFCAMTPGGHWQTFRKPANGWVVSRCLCGSWKVWQAGLNSKCVFFSSVFWLYRC